MVLLNGRKKGAKKKRSSKRRAAHAINPHHHKRTHHRRRRNPAGIAEFGPRGIGGTLMRVAIGAAGGLGTSLAVNALAPALPAQFQTGWGKVGLKAAAIGAAAFVLPHFFGRRATAEIVIGAGTVVAVDAAREFIGPSIPGLAGLMDSPYVRLSGLRGYSAPGRSLGPGALSPVRPPAWAMRRAA